MGEQKNDLAQRSHLCDLSWVVSRPSSLINHIQRVNHIVHYNNYGSKLILLCLCTRILCAKASLICSELVFTFDLDRFDKFLGKNTLNTNRLIPFLTLLFFRYGIIRYS
jgi:hypothetical protein